MVEPLPRFDFGRMQQFSAIQNYMFGMRITVWRNVKLHTSSFVRNSFFVLYDELHPINGRHNLRVNSGKRLVTAYDRYLPGPKCDAMDY